MTAVAGWSLVGCGGPAPRASAPPVTQRPTTVPAPAFVLVTSAHSDAITDWDHSGDAIVAIHGPLGSDRAIGTSGAAISHGCIRLHEPDLLRL